MEVLTPVQPEPIQQEVRSDLPKDFLDAGITLKNVEFLHHLGLKDEMFNPRIMEKVDFIASKLEDIGHLQDVDMRLGDDGSMTRIDKIYTYLKLLEQSDSLKEKQALIDERMKAYGRS